MWLTGFDAPVLHTMYVDKPMRDHGLLQAIARVNRVFEDKPGGLVVDYIGIGDDLRAGLKAYAQGDVDDMVVSLEVAQKNLQEQWEVVCDLLHGIEFRAADGATPGQRATVLALGAQAAVARFVLDDDQVRTYLDQQAQFATWFKLVSPNPPSVAMRYDHDFFATVAAALRAALAEEQERHGASLEARRAVEQFFSDGLAGGEIVDVFEIAGEQRPEISVLTDEFLDDIGAKLTQPELQVALLRKLLRGEIRTRLAANQTMNKRFSDELQAVLDRYHAKQITAAEVVKALVELAKKLRDQRQRHEQLGLSPEETAFYDVLAARGEELGRRPAAEGHRRRDRPPASARTSPVDWTQRGNLEAKIRSRIKRLLRKHKLALDSATGGGGLDQMADRVFQQARTLYERWPEIEGDQVFLA